jgi:hypothetical protein
MARVTDRIHERQHVRHPSPVQTPILGGFEPRLRSDGGTLAHTRQTVPTIVALQKRVGQLSSAVGTPGPGEGFGAP